jgi:hypothetical protein
LPPLLEVFQYHIGFFALKNLFEDLAMEPFCAAVQIQVARDLIQVVPDQSEMAAKTAPFEVFVAEAEIGHTKSWNGCTS